MWWRRTSTIVYMLSVTSSGENSLKTRPCIHHPPTHAHTQRGRFNILLGIQSIMKLLTGKFRIIGVGIYKVCIINVLRMPMHKYPCASTKVLPMLRKTVTDVSHNIWRISRWWKKLSALVNHSSFCLPYQTTNWIKCTQHYKFKNWD